MNNSSKYILYAQQLFTKGWEVSILLMLVFMEKQHLISLHELGILSTTIAVIQILSTFFASHVIIRIGSKKALALSIISYLIAWTILSISSQFFMLFFAYVFGGVGSGMLETIGISSVAKSLNKGKRASGIGNLSSMGDIGRIVLTGLTSTFAVVLGISITARLYGLLVLIGLTLFIILFKEISVSKKDTSITLFHTSSYIKNSNFMFVVFAGILDSFASSSLYIFIPLLLIQKGININTSGFLTALLFGGYMSGRVFLGKLSDTFSPQKVLIFAEIGMALLIVFFMFTNNVYVICCVMFLLGVFTRGTSPVLKALAVDSLHHNQSIEKGVGLYQFSGRVSTALSRSVFGYSAGTFGIMSVFIISSLVAVSTIVPIKLIRHNEK
ncbi:MAG: MFS transporter [Candidatus Roizmanbacteria bacterium]